MPITIFYSWQTDSPRTTNRTFIEGALKKAIKNLQADVELVNSIRNQSLGLDKDTKDVPGTPPIVQTIFGKIDECAAFVWCREVHQGKGTSPPSASSTTGIFSLFCDA